MRALGITFISLALTTAVIGNAYYRKKQFYPSVVYITKSNPSMAVIYIQAFILVFLMGKLMRKVFFGELRAAEFEHLMERSWYAVTETCLAFTLFRDDFSPKFVALFTVLLFLKSFHWLAEDRVDFMERSPVISWLFHVRVLSLLSILGALDLSFINHAYQSTVTKGASVQLVFGFEYAILATIILNIAIKYILHTVDLNSENPWESKTVFLLYTEVIMGFIKVCLYVTFVVIMIRLYTLPLFAFRPMYYTMRKFKQACNDVILSRRAIQNMNTLYPDATPEELAAADNVCIICREEMTTASKKLPCNHIFHTSCLRSWFQRQQTCPTCRLNILRTTTPRTTAPPPQQPQPGFPFQGLNGAIFRQLPFPPQYQAFYPRIAPGNFPFWQQAPPAPPQAPQQQQQQQQGSQGDAGATNAAPGQNENETTPDSELRQRGQMPPFAAVPPGFYPPIFVRQRDAAGQNENEGTSDADARQRGQMPPFGAVPPGFYPPMFVRQRDGASAAAAGQNEAEGTSEAEMRQRAQMPPFGAAPPGFYPPMFVRQRDGAAGSSAPGQGDNEGSSESDARRFQMPPFGAVPPGFFPPIFSMFPPPTMPPPMPPPMPPSNFSGLSDEDLRRMEGDARENIEARLQCLRQIELLLDASVTVMQQYMTTVTATNIYRNSARTSPSGSTSQEATTSPNGSSHGAPGKPAEEKTEEASTSRAEERKKDEDASSPEQKEMRRLRLQKFGNEANPAN